MKLRYRTSLPWQLGLLNKPRVSKKYKENRPEMEHFRRVKLDNVKDSTKRFEDP